MTLLYEVVFMTYGDPNPERLGTTEKVGATMRLWAPNGDEACALAREIAEIKGREWLGMLSAQAVDGVILEQILNDPLNNYDFMHDVYARRRGAVGPVGVPELKEDMDVEIV
jgi:hypothetical protein